MGKQIGLVRVELITGTVYTVAVDWWDSWLGDPQDRVRSGTKRWSNREGVKASMVWINPEAIAATELLSISDPPEG